MRQIAVLGIDLGKNSCSLAGLDPSGAVVLRRRMRREAVIAFAAGLPACVVARRPAAARTTSDAPSARRATRCG